MLDRSSQLVRRESGRLWTSLLLVAVALVCDEVDRRTPFSVLGTGLLDEPAHLATAALALLVLAQVLELPRRFYVAALVASVAIDLDHIPLYLGVPHIEVAPGGRPFTHSLLTVGVVLVVALLVRRWRVVLLGVATGLVVHFARDVVEGHPGVALFWPVDRHEYVGGQPAFVAIVAGLLVLRLATALAGSRGPVR